MGEAKCHVTNDFGFLEGQQSLVVAARGQQAVGVRRLMGFMGSMGFMIFIIPMLPIIRR